MSGAPAARYTVHGMIGRGGCAAVHVGRLRGAFSFARTVAIKRLHPELARDRAVLAGFVEEARLGARVADAHVVPTLDAIGQGGELFVVMEYVHGESLARLLAATAERDARVPWAIALAIVRDLLRGLHSAHEARGPGGAPLGLVHRDVSPANVIVGVGGVAQLLDFGIAKARGHSLLTRQGQVKGKLGYMAPEQLCGEPLDRRADVYAAGVVLWEALVGERLFAGEDEDAVVERVLAGETSPPSAHVPALPPAFDAVFARAVAPEPARRFATAHEMALALESCGDAAPPSEVGEWVRATAAPELEARARLIAESERGHPIFELVTRSGARAGGPAGLAPRRATIPFGAPIALSALVALGALVYAYARPTGSVARVPAPPTPSAEGEALAEAPPLDIESPDAPDASPVNAERPRARTNARPAKGPCNPPYFIDVDGHKRWKRACF
jgi:eukaryotic-like serine/threonine-protein kinase